MVIVTGATGAIGTEIARALAAQGHDLLLGCRNKDKATALIAELAESYPQISAEFLPLDLTSEARIRTTVELLPSMLRGRKLEGVIHNAGTMQRRFVADEHGRELTMTVNYRHTALLHTLMLESGLLGPGAAVVFTTSLTRYMRRGSAMPKEPCESSFSQLGSYASSKKALTLFARAQATAHPELRINCADPGVVNSSMIHMDRWFDPLADIFFRPFIRTPKSGALPALRAFRASGSGKIYTRRRTHTL